MNDDRRPLWPWIMALLIGLPVVYVASFGPACWLTASGHVEKSTLQQLYRPIFYRAGIGHSPIRVRHAIQWWGSLGIPSGKSVGLVWHEPWPFSTFPNRQILVFRGEGRKF